MASARRKSYTIEYKINILKQVDTNGVDKVARQSGIDRRCLQRWRKNRQKLNSTAQTRSGAKQKRIPNSETKKGCQYPLMEKDLNQWIISERGKG